MNYDVAVLGAGIIGVSTAVHLQQRGLSVCLIDKSSPGSGTSYGNAGLIERSSVVPYAFPRDAKRLLRYALNGQPDVRYSPFYLPAAAPWLLEYWNNSSPEKLAQATEDMLPLIERSVEEHDVLIELAGAGHLVKSKGWIEVFRTREATHKAFDEARSLERFGLSFDLLEQPQLSGLEPSLKNSVHGGIHWRDPKTVTDPEALTKAYAALYSKEGGEIVTDEILSLAEAIDGWNVKCAKGTVRAKSVVIALGAQSGLLLKQLGVKVPLGVKRGYHMHYSTLDGYTSLEHSVCDTEGGFVLSPMTKGVRLTTGIEFANPNSRVNEIQLSRARAIAQEIYPLGEPLETEPWLGLRPCLPDMRPVIGRGDRPGLWFNFGHAHHGLTLGPASGRLLAEMITGQKTFTDPAPYAISRFA